MSSNLKPGSQDRSESPGNAHSVPGDDIIPAALNGARKTLLKVPFWAWLAFIYGIFWSILAAYGFHISNEHGTMENAQAWCLIVGFFMFGWLAIRVERRSFRLLFAALALFYLSFFLREVEVEDLNIPHVLILLGSGAGKKYLLLTCWIIALVFFLAHLKQTWLAFRRWMGTVAGISIVLGGIFYLIGMPFDKKVFDIEYDLNVLVEEIFESIATAWMLISAFVSVLLFGQRTADHGT